jgi:hypothetical protein
MNGGLDYDRRCMVCGYLCDSRDMYRSHRRNSDCYGKRATLEYDSNLNLVPKKKAAI